MLALAAAYPYVDVRFPTALKKLFKISFFGILNDLGKPSIVPLTNPIDEAKIVDILLPSM